jgi:signal transduction histidine kinase/ActR/RegA family two-component response regulator
VFGEVSISVQSTPPVPAAPSGVRALSRLRRAAVLAVVLPALAFAAVVLMFYRQSFDDAESRLQSSVRIAREHALKVFDTNEMLLVRMLDLLGTAGDAEWLARSAELHERLKTMAVGLPQIQGLFVMGTDDRMLASNRMFPPPRHINYSDRDFARVHRSGTGPRVFFTEQLVSRATGERFFDMSRRRSLRDGAYGGTVSVSLRPEYFHAFWQEMAQASPGLRLALVRADGRLIAGWPDEVPEGGVIPPTHPLMEKIRRGEDGRPFDADAAFENVRRVNAFLRLGEHPVYIVTSFNRSAILAAWAARAGLLALFAIPLIAAVGVMATVGYRRTHDELAAAERLQHETTRREGAELAQELLRREKAALEESERAKDNFLAILSHELRTPLNAVCGWAHMLRMGQVEPAASQRALDAILRNANAQLQLVDDLLDVSRVSAGKMRLEVQPVDLRTVVEAALDAVRPAAAAKEIRFQSVLESGDVAVMGDAARLQQVVWNLLMNAVKFTPKGGRVQIHLLRVNSHMEIVVSDTGQGIAPDVLPFIFERFRQADSSSTRAHVGLGLGLALVKHLVELHGGSVVAESGGEGKGATFIVKLPVSVVQVPDEPVPREHPTATPLTLPASAVRLDGLRVLCVDDDEDALDLAAAILIAAGATVRTCRSAPAALELVAQWRPDVLVSDIEMPGEDGHALIRRVRALGADQGGATPAVALSAYGRTQDRTRSLTAGYNMHVPKPVNPGELTAIIASLAGRRSELQRSDAGTC